MTNNMNLKPISVAVGVLVDSEDVASLWAQPAAVFLVCRFVVLWIGWVWSAAVTREMHHALLVFAVKVEVSLYVTDTRAVVLVNNSVGVVI